jgi:hypothetical protein
MRGVIKKEDYAYIAGLWDADGSYIMSKHVASGRHNGKRGFCWEIRMTIGMKEVEALNFVKNKFHKKRLRVTKLKSGSLFYFLTLYSNEIRKYLPQIAKYAKVKKRQANILLKAVSIIKPKSDKNTDLKLEKLFRIIKVLNHSVIKDTKK